MNRAPMIAVVGLVLLILLGGATFAFDLRVESSTGTAEIDLGSAWLQAVSGREVPVGAGVATWYASTLSLRTEGFAFRLGGLSLARVLSGEPEIRVGLIAGSADITADGVPTRFETNYGVVVFDRARVSYDSGRLDVLDGGVTVEYRGGVRRVDAPASMRIDLLPRGALLDDY